MARKTTRTTKMPDTATEDLRLVRLQLPPDEHRKFRMLAGREDTSMAILARRIILEWIAKEQKGGSK